MPDVPILLKVLLRQHHWQQYAVFCAEYDKAAQRLDDDLERTYPSRAQLHRWLSGSVRSLPYPDHCRVLEEMFPGRTAEQLFSSCPPEILHASGPASLPVPGGQDAQARLTALSAPSIGIRPFIERAFDREHVTIDFAGFSGETLHGVTQEPLDMIRMGQGKPQVTDHAAPAPRHHPAHGAALPHRGPGRRPRLPRPRPRHHHPARPRHRRQRPGTHRHGPHRDRHRQIRAHPCPPLFKLYILNGEEAFFGFYPIVQHNIQLTSGPRVMYDLMGKDALVFRYSQHSGNPADQLYIEQARHWFDTMWQTISYEYTG